MSPSPPHHHPARIGSRPRCPSPKRMRLTRRSWRSRRPDSPCPRLARCVARPRARGRRSLSQSLQYCRLVRVGRRPRGLGPKRAHPVRRSRYSRRPSSLCPRARGRRSPGLSPPYRRLIRMGSRSRCTSPKRAHPARCSQRSRHGPEFAAPSSGASRRVLLISLLSLTELEPAVSSLDKYRQPSRRPSPNRTHPTCRSRHSRRSSSLRPRPAHRAARP